MSAIEKFYKKDNYTIQKSINIEEGLYVRLKEVGDNDYDATISELVNVCVEDLFTRKIEEIYEKPEGEIILYRSIMLRRENVEELNRLSKKERISVTRLVNMAIKEFLDEYEKKDK